MRVYCPYCKKEVEYKRRKKRCKRILRNGNKHL